MEFLEGNDWPDWDPDYPLSDRDNNKDNQPISPDAWADEEEDGGC